MIGSTASHVHLHVGRHVHPIYREQLHAVPSGWRYVWSHPALTEASVPTKGIVQRASALGRLAHRAEQGALSVLGKAGYVHANRLSAPAPDIRLVHSAERLLVRSPRPYVLDLEHAHLFTVYQQVALSRPWTRRLLARALLDERLRYLLPWSDAAARSLRTVVDASAFERIKPKIRTVLPAVRPAVNAPPRRPPGAPLRVLFVGTWYREKGALAALHALRRVRESHDVRLEMVCYLPDAHVRRWDGEPGLTLHRPGPFDLVRDLYGRSDAFLFPSHMDTFGWVTMEAASYGLPVIAPRHLAYAETVQDGRTGLLFEPENMLWNVDGSCRFDQTLPVPKSYLRALEHPSASYVDRIAAQLTRMSEDRAFQQQLAEGALDAVRSGHLSIGRRRAQLAEIYDEAAR